MSSREFHDLASSLAVSLNSTAFVMLPGPAKCMLSVVEEPCVCNVVFDVSETVGSFH